MARPLFHSPDHDHARCEADAIADAEALCAAQGLRLTPLRRQVLAVMLSAHRPFGAYEIMDRLADRGPRPAPITVYRALDFLIEHRLVHRIASRNAFIACIGDHSGSTGDSVVFLICERCGDVGEALSPAVRDALNGAAAAVGFAPSTPLIEVVGVCAHCRAGKSG